MKNFTPKNFTYVPFLFALHVKFNLLYLKQLLTQKQLEADEMIKKVMARAHELAKTMTGHYSARLILSLRQAWREARGLERRKEWSFVTPRGSEVSVVTTANPTPHRTEYIISAVIIGGKEVPAVKGSHQGNLAAEFVVDGKKAVIILPSELRVFIEKEARANKAALAEARKPYLREKHRREYGEDYGDVAAIRRGI
ncbi:hypothetical protein WMW72_10670 [Paenibacillus filicis]|uniref:Uncharacterized protein n=1 Tax=Paenibacillus filicis TaxID=669464 RepID=A0ABU9DHR5_9BACL